MNPAVAKGSGLRPIVLPEVILYVFFLYNFNFYIYNVFIKKKDIHLLLFVT